MPDLITTLRGLLEKATPGPWKVGDYDDCAGYDGMTGGIRVGPIVLDGADYGQGWFKELQPAARQRMESDAGLIATLRNHAEAILRVVEAARDFVDAKRTVIESISECREALAALDNNANPDA